MRYKLHVPMLAVKPLPVGEAAVSFPLSAGTVLYSAREIPLRGLIDVQCNGESIQVFAEDLRSRANKIETAEGD
jgi:hypothetical protein